MKKTRITIICFLIILFSNYASFSQSVSLNSLLLNGQILNGTAPINIGTTNATSNITFNAEVKLLTAPSDTNPGAITVYYKRNSTYSPVVCNGGNQTSLLFLGGTVATQSFVIQLTNAQFDAAGGLFYAEYKTYSGVIYKSANISIVKNVTTTPSNPPTPVSAAFENVPYGGIPILPSLRTSAFGQEFSWTDDYHEYQNGQNTFSIYGRNGKTPVYTGMTLFERLVWSQNGEIIQESVSRPFVIYVKKPFINGRDFINTISKDQYIVYGSNAQTIIGDQASYSLLGDNTGARILINNYQWQKRIVSIAPENLYNMYTDYKEIYGWKDIPLATQASYTPLANITQVTEYRRLIVDNSTGIEINKSYGSSNVVTIYPITVNLLNNSICCSQSNYTNVPIVPIVGSEISGSYMYQWQIGSLMNGEYTWSDIAEANNRDYLPVRPERRFPNGIIGYFRRNLIKKSDYTYYLSNIVSVTFYTTSSSRIANKSVNDSIDTQLLDDSIMISPNPSSSVINIDSVYNLPFFDLKVIDMTGRLVISKTFSQSSINTFQLNISELPIGVYSLILENKESRVIKKIIKS